MGGQPAAAADISAPSLIEFDFTPKAVDVSSSSQDIVVTARVVDETGSRAPTVIVTSTATSQSLGFGSMSRVSGTDTDGVYAHTVTIPTTAASGEWEVTIYPLRDALGNSQDWFNDHPQPLVVTNAPTDTSSPILQGFDFTPKSVNVGTGAKQVVVTAHVTDATGADAPTLILSSLSSTQSLGFGSMTRVSGTATDGVYERTVTIPTTAAPGQWEVTIYPLRDTLGNDEDWFHDHPELLVIENNAGDQASPSLVEFDFTPKTVNLDGDARDVVVTARVTDDTGADAPTLILSSLNTTQSLGFGSMTRISGTATDGIYERTVTIPTTAAPGQWEVTIYPLRDILGNDEDRFHTHPEALTLTENVGDSEPPVLDSFTYPHRTFDLAAGGSDLTITAVVSDATGAEPPVATLVSDDTGAVLGPVTLVQMSGSDTDGIYEGAIFIPADAPTGTWELVLAPLRDFNGNEQADPNRHPRKVTVIDTSVTIPGVPESIEAVAGDGTASVSWLPPTSDGGSSITSYIVTAQQSGETKSVDGGVTSVEFTNLTNGRNYIFTVSAVNSEGEGPFATSNLVVPAGLPSAPARPQVLASVGIAIVTWARPASDGGTPITGYEITTSPGGYTETVPAGTVTQTKITGLTNGRSYTFTVRAINAVGRGPASQASIPATPADLPAAPPRPTAVAGNGQATISWTPPKDNGGASISGYKITSLPGNISRTVNGSARSVTLTGLTNDVAYTFTVQAMNHVGISPASARSMAVMPTKPFDLYTTPGYHRVNDREWHTVCQQYSPTVDRCRTEILATQVSYANGAFTSKTGWVFNNLTYAASPRAQWKANPLAANGVTGGSISWTAADGRKWRTECDTAATGRNGCRSYIVASVIEAYTGSDGATAYRWVTKWIFNNMVRFK